MMYLVMILGGCVFGLIVGLMSHEGGEPKNKPPKSYKPKRKINNNDEYHPYKGINYGTLTEYDH